MNAVTMLYSNPQCTVEGLTMASLYERVFSVRALLATMVAGILLAVLPIHGSAATGDVKKPTTRPVSVPRYFASADQAMEAFATAVKAGDMAELRAILGPAGEAILASGDPMEDKATRERFATAYDESHKLDKRRVAKAWILVGKDEWPLPIPIVQRGPAWMFDAKAGREELLNRRIGRNELSTMQAMLAYVDAQQEYYVRNPEKASMLQYAQKFVSTPDKRDGLYFPTKAGEKPSPLGPLFDARRAAGNVADGKPMPYHGYYYRILKGQGPKASGGAYDYVVSGKMIGGFALVAYPATYGNSGVMTFVVNHDGVVYEKNLGPQTAEIAQKMVRFNPDDTWTRRDNAGL